MTSTGHIQIRGLFLPWLPAILSAAIWLALSIGGVEFGVQIGVAGLSFGALTFALNQLQLRAGSGPRSVTYICASSGSTSLQRAEGARSRLIEDGWICAIEVPPNPIQDLAQWQVERIRAAVNRRVDAIVIENRGTLPEINASIAQTKALGVHVIVIGDSYEDVGVEPAASCTVVSDAAIGGSLAAQIAIDYANSVEGIVHIVASVMSKPTTNRDRAAYCTLTLELSRLTGGYEFMSIAAENSRDYSDITVECTKLLQSGVDHIVVICITDDQLLAIASDFIHRFNRQKISRIHLIGYNGERDRSNILSVNRSPVHVLGTVDAKPHDQGRMAAKEISSISSGLPAHTRISSRPQSIVSGLDETSLR